MILMTAVSLANDIFGFNGWSSQVISLSVDYVGASPKPPHFASASHHFLAGYSAILTANTPETVGALMLQRSSELL
jgi:recombination DNA repair RAD52 pathway protein